MSAQWPTATATDTQLYIAVNELQTNLSSGINSAVTSLTLNSATNFPASGTVLIDNEVIKYTGISTNTLTGLTRGFDGTTAASHSAAAIVSYAIIADHHNALTAEIKAIEADLQNRFGYGNATPANSRIVPINTSAAQWLYTATSTGVLSGVSLTASRAVVTDANGLPAISAVTATELGYVSGVTSALQAQIDAKIVKSGNVNAAGYIIGTIPQTVKAIYASGVTTTSNSYVTTNLTATITPKATTHKIKVTVVGVIDAPSGSSCFVTLYRGATDLETLEGNTGNGFGAVGSGTLALVSNGGFVYLDSPATTGATTYTVKFRSNAAATCHWNQNTCTTYILLEEIAF